MATFVLQTRWLGNDDWTNAVYVGRSVGHDEEAQRKAEASAFEHALDSENEAAREEAADEGREHVDYQSLAEIREKSNGDFCFAGWIV